MFIFYQLDKIEGKLHLNLQIQLQRKRLPRTWTVANSTVQLSKWNFPKLPLFLLLVHPSVVPLEDQEPDVTGPDLSPALVHAHAPAHLHQPTSDAEAQEGTLLALVIVIVTLSAAGRTVVVVHLDATFIDQIVLVPVLAPLFVAIT